jgi:hypothetical protein
MTRPRHKPSGVQMLREIQGRVSAVERGTKHPLAPMAVANAATINQTVAQSPFVALVNPAGTQVTWWVLVTPAVGTTTSLRLRTAAGLMGAVVTADSTAASIVQVILTIESGWDPGDLQLVYLDAWIDVNSATVLPVRAQIS